MSEGYHHKIRLGVILIHDQKLLLVRQNNRPFWVFPGGTLETDEGLEECAIREMQEEVNLTVSIEKILYLSDFFKPGFNSNSIEEDLPPGLDTPSIASRHKASGAQDNWLHTLDIFMLARYETGTPLMTVNENLNEMNFFTLEEVRELAIEPHVVANQLLIDWPRQFLQVSGLYLGKY